MASTTYYRLQAQRCLLLSHATLDIRARLCLTDMAAYYLGKARGAEDDRDRAQERADAALSPRAA
jgi:hypothetical protein